ncbi:MAG: dihydrodipicolinate synthase family protein, partial [Solirubrobacteraceae bacterium]
MNRDSVGWRGYIPAIATPFTADGALDGAGWAESLEWMIAEGMHGVIVAGTTGEWFSLEHHERVELFRIAGEVVSRRIPVIAGCNAFTAREVVAYAQAAERSGLDGILVTPPPYVVPTRKEVVCFYQTVSDQIELPMCVYNWPR